MTATAPTTRSSPGGVARALRILVVGAAAAGGWFAYEGRVAGLDVDSLSSLVDRGAEETAADEAPEPGSDGVVAGLASPWPADVPALTAPWTSSRTTVARADDVVRLRVETDRAGRVALATFGTDGAAEVRAELDLDDPTSAWVDDGGSWRRADADGPTGAAALNRLAVGAPPPTLDDLLAPEAWPFTELVADDTAADGVARLRVVTVRVDAAEFARVEPALAAQWRHGSWVELGPGQPLLRASLDDGGHVVEVVADTVRGPMIYRFAELDAPLELSSPVADA